MSIGIPLKNCFSLVKAHPFIKTNKPPKNINYNFINDYIYYHNMKEHEKIFNFTNFSNNINLKSLIRSKPKNKRLYLDSETAKTNNNDEIEIDDDLIKSTHKIKYKILNNNNNENDLYSNRENKKERIKPTLSNKKLAIDKNDKKNFKEVNDGNLALFENYSNNLFPYESNNNGESCGSKNNFNTIKYLSSTRNKESLNINNNNLIQKVNSHPNISYNSNNSLNSFNNSNINKSTTKSVINNTNKKGNYLTQSTVYTNRIHSPISYMVSPRLSLKEEQLNYRYSCGNENKKNTGYKKKSNYINRRNFLYSRKKKGGLSPLLDERIDCKRRNKLMKSLFGDSDLKKQYLKFVESKNLTLRANIIFNRIQNTRGGKQELRSNYNPLNV